MMNSSSKSKASKRMLILVVFGSLAMKCLATRLGLEDHDIKVATRGKHGYSYGNGIYKYKRHCGKGGLDSVGKLFPGFFHYEGDNGFDLVAKSICYDALKDLHHPKIIPNDGKHNNILRMLDTMEVGKRGTNMFEEVSKRAGILQWALFRGGEIVAFLPFRKSYLEDKERQLFLPKNVPYMNIPHKTLEWEGRAHFKNIFAHKPGSPEQDRYLKWKANFEKELAICNQNAAKEARKRGMRWNAATKVQYLNKGPRIYVFEMTMEERQKNKTETKKENDEKRVAKECRAIIDANRKYMKVQDRDIDNVQQFKMGSSKYRKVAAGSLEDVRERLDKLTKKRKRRPLKAASNFCTTPEEAYGAFVDWVHNLIGNPIPHFKFRVKMKEWLENNNRQITPKEESRLIDVAHAYKQYRKFIDEVDRKIREKQATRSYVENTDDKERKLVLQRLRDQGTQNRLKLELLVAAERAQSKLIQKEEEKAE